MIVCESALLTILAALLSVSSYTDCKAGVIRNPHLRGAVIPAAALNALYYGFFAAPYWTIFLLNIALLIVISLLFYGYHLWGAGDSKLFIVAGLCLPGRFYTLWDSPFSSSFTVVIIVFSCAFLYVIGESVVLGVRNRNLLSFSTEAWNIRRGLLSYFAMVGTLTLLNFLLSPMFSRFSPALSAAVNFLLVLTLIQIRDKLPPAVVRFASISVWVALFLLTLWNRFSWTVTVHYKSWIVVFLVMFFRMAAEKYNYRAIPTEEIKAGQILSAGTVLNFTASRVRGLPSGRTEDLRSRLTPEEADAVRRWGKSARGKPWVVIVRKMPFAIFIAVGYAAFVTLEVVMQ